MKLLQEDALQIEREQPQLRPRVIGIDATEHLKPDGSFVRAKAEPKAVKEFVTWRVVMKRSKRKALPGNKLERMLEKLERIKASMRAKVEHPFHVSKNLFRPHKL